MTQLELSGISAGYGSVRALHGISIKVDKGAMVALLGANGAGKSTTLKSISGLLKPERGEVTRGDYSPSGVGYRSLLHS